MHAAAGRRVLAARTTWLPGLMALAAVLSLLALPPTLAWYLLAAAALVFTPALGSLLRRLQAAALRSGRLGLPAAAITGWAVLAATCTAAAVAAQRPDLAAATLVAGVAQPLATLGLLRAAGRRQAQRLGLSMAVARGVRELPEGFVGGAGAPGRAVRDLVGRALRDVVQLRALLRDLAQERAVDGRALLAEAEATVLQMLRRGPVLARLADLAHEHGHRPEVQQAVERATARLERQGEALHATVAAAIRTVAAGDEGAGDTPLRLRAEDLQGLADSRAQAEEAAAWAEIELGEPSATRGR